LARENDERDAAGKADRDRIRDELDRAAQRKSPEPDENKTGHERRHDEAIDTVLRHDSETITTKAPVGPPIWTREPPSNEMRKPATMAV